LLQKSLPRLSIGENAPGKTRRSTAKKSTPVSSPLGAFSVQRLLTKSTRRSRTRSLNELDGSNSCNSCCGGKLANPSGNFALAGSYDARHDDTYQTAAVTTTYQG
jgi:hypothetical protein